MIKEKLEIPTLSAEVNLYCPDRLADYPGVVFITDVWGVRPATIAMAKRLAEKGFAVLLPNAFHRYSRNRPDGFWVEDETDRNRALQELFAALTPDRMDSDGKAYVDFLQAQTHVQGGKVGVVGHCYTGQMALRMAAVLPDRIAAAASFHGGWLATDKPDSAHLLLPQVKARLYFGHADNDQLMPKEWIDRLESALREWRGAFESEVYKGAAHGWTVPGRDGVYNELQAERAFEKEVELFDATLKA
jgi:carboxymethylenebutenolidase